MKRDFTYWMIWCRNRTIEQIMKVRQALKKDEEKSALKAASLCKMYSAGPVSISRMGRWTSSRPNAMNVPTIMNDDYAEVEKRLFAYYESEGPRFK